MNTSSKFGLPINSAAIGNFNAAFSFRVATPPRFERGTSPLGGARSIQLSYGVSGRIVGPGSVPVHPVQLWNWGPHLLRLAAALCRALLIERAGFGVGILK